MAKRDVTEMIEQLEALEQRVGIRLDAMSAYLTRDDWVEDDELWNVEIMGEIHALDGNGIPENIKLQFAIYDLKGRIICQDHEYVYADKFFGLETFSAYLSDLPTNDISKIRIIAKPD